MKRTAPILGCALLVAGAALSGPVSAEEQPITLKIRDHRFTPSEVEIPAGEKRLFVIQNDDESAEEFESHSLHREKIIPGKSKANVYIGPLRPGRYEFYGEFNEATAKGVVVAK